MALRSLRRAAPALLHVVFLGQRLLAFQLGPLWINAVCSPVGAFAGQSERSESAILEALLVAASAIAGHIVEYRPAQAVIV